jgi:K+-transporting ATPase ATPase C chain
MRRQLYPALMMTVVFTVLLGIAYPLAVTGVAQGVFADRADGSKVEVDGVVVGSRLLGQTFTRAKYFHGRPSAAGAAAAGARGGRPDDLAQDVSAGSNLGPTNPDLLRSVATRAARYREENGLPPRAAVPVDAVTASASGLDPHISIANARIQARRVARVRGLPLARVRVLIDDHTDPRTLGFLGEPGVNVLELNVALDLATSP